MANLGGVEGTIRALILCAGKSTRMKSKLSKVLHPLGGLPLVGHVLETLGQANIAQKALVVSPDFKDEGAYTSVWPTFIQKTQRGTGHAVMAAEEFFVDQGPGTLLVLYGDTPLLSCETLKKVIDTHHHTKAAITVVGMEVDEPHSYGRLLLNQEGFCEKIIEDKEATALQKQNRLCNSGIMVFDQQNLKFLLDQLQDKNDKKEFYLTDTIHIAHTHGLKVAVEIGDKKEMAGVNTRQDLAHAESIFQQSRLEDFMNQGVTFKDPQSVKVSFDTHIEEDVIIEPHVIMGPGVHIETGAIIRGFSYLEGCVIGAHAQVGPFARLRPETHIGASAKIGNFVEIKKSSLGRQTKVGHLSYIGDAILGSDVNIGAGTITCNYDGSKKHTTRIGDRTFIGANTALIAPVSIGEDCVVGAGSVITKNVESGTLAISRSPQTSLPRKLKRPESSPHIEST